MKRVVRTQYSHAFAVFMFVAILTLLLSLASPPASAQTSPLFLPAVTYDSGGIIPTSAAVADLNGDGNPDLVVANGEGGANGQGSVAILLGNGDGTFHLSDSFDSGAGFAKSVAVADLNGDGKLDLVVANCGSTSKPGNCPNQESDGIVAIFVGNGNATFQAPMTYDSGGGQSVSVLVADVNLDGIPDVLVVNGCADQACTSPGGVGVLLGNGDGTFQPVLTYSGVGQSSVAVDDVNGDGKPDLILGGPCTCVSVLLGNADGTFQFSAFYEVGGLDGVSVAVADVNRDGKPDVVAVSWGTQLETNDGFVSVLAGNGDGTFQPAVIYPSGGVVSLSVAVADVNGDGKPDVLVASCALEACSTTAEGTLSVLLGIGDGTFSPAVSYGSGGAYADSLTVADANGDGRPDLIATNFFSNNVGVLLNNGPYLDRTPPIVTLSATPTVLWPPNGKMVSVTLSGTISDTGSGVNASSAAYVVRDEYGEVQPNGAITLGPGGNYSFTLLLQASRIGPDLDGRHYTVTVLAKDNVGNIGAKMSLVTVPHDQGH